MAWWQARAAAMVVALLIGAASPAPAQTTGDPVSVDGGRISGAWRANSGVRAYLGVPFAAAPVGALRWQPPQPVAPWQGVRAATAYAPQCLQKSRSHTSVYFEYAGAQPSSEDCLYLNVWAPAGTPDRHLPVMVWIYGGGFQQGSAANPVFDGTALAGRGVVVVSLNYRLGVFGFFAHPDLTAESARHASGNYGLLDQVAALQWVRRNAAAFGGNPDNVTIFGQSAGGASVDMLMGSPLARGLFQHAIAESFGVDRRMPTLAQAQEAGSVLAAKLGTPGAAGLRNLPARQLLDAAGAWWPIVDGYFLTEDIYTAFQQGHEAPVPLLTGWNANEGATFPHAGTLEAYQESVRRSYGESADRILMAYPARDDTDAKRASEALFGDGRLAWGAWASARLHARNGFPTYAYYFQHPQPLLPGSSYDEIDLPDGLGTFHSSEYPYVFGSLAVLARAWTEADRALSAQLGAFWSAYAITGNPNAAGLPYWPPFRAAGDSVMHLGDETGEGPVPHLDRLRLLDDLSAPLAANRF